MAVDWRLEGGREALDNVASVGKHVGLIVCRTLFLIGFEVRQSQLHTDEKSHLLCVFIYTLKLAVMFVYFAHYNQRFPVSSLPDEVSHSFGSDRMSTHVGCGASSLSWSTLNGNTSAV